MPAEEEVGSVRTSIVFDHGRKVRGEMHKAFRAIQLFVQYTVVSSVCLTVSSVASTAAGRRSVTANFGPS